MQGWGAVLVLRGWEAAVALFWLVKGAWRRFGFASGRGLALPPPSVAGAKGTAGLRPPVRMAPGVGGRGHAQQAAKPARALGPSYRRRRQRPKPLTCKAEPTPTPSTPKNEANPDAPTPGDMRSKRRSPRAPLTPPTGGSGSARNLSLARQNQPRRLPPPRTKQTQTPPPPGPCAASGEARERPWPLLPEAAAAPEPSHLQGRTPPTPSTPKNETNPDAPTPGAMRSKRRSPRTPLAPPTEGSGSARTLSLARQNHPRNLPPPRTKQTQTLPPPGPCAASGEARRALGPSYRRGAVAPSPSHLKERSSAKPLSLARTKQRALLVNRIVVRSVGEHVLHVVEIL